VTGRWHDVARQARILARNVRVSRRLRGAAGLAARRAGLEAVYHATNRLLASLGVDYWLVYGTLLGYHREGRLLDGDRDVDFGAHEREYARIWEARHALPADCRMVDTSRNHFGPKLYVVCRAWEADIYFYRDDGLTLQSWERSGNPGDVAPFARHVVYPLRAVTFLGETTRIPADAEAYLRHTYGYIGPNAERDPATGYWREKTT
jgi:hypothetical protein